MINEIVKKRQEVMKKEVIRETLGGKMWKCERKKSSYGTSTQTR